MRSARHNSRVAVLQGLYEWLVAGAEPRGIAKSIEEGSRWAKLDQSYFAALWDGVHEHAAGLQTAVEPHLDRPWPEVSPVERAILLLGAFELTHRPDIPYRVAINEAVELAKSFGGTDGHKFVNGVLDKFALATRAAERSQPRAPAESGAD